MSRITRKPRKPTDSGVYVLTCDNNTCDEVYVGQSANIPRRISQHIQARNADSESYASARHSRKEGHNLEYERPLVVYRSNSEDHRLIVETSLISLCHTIEGNKSSAVKKDIETLGPMVLKGAPINWRQLAKVKPSCVNPQAVPRKYRSFFSHRVREPSIADTSILEAQSNIPSDSTLDADRSLGDTTSHSRSSYNLRSSRPIDLNVPSTA